MHQQISQQQKNRHRDCTIECEVDRTVSSFFFSFHFLLHRLLHCPSFLATHYATRRMFCCGKSSCSRRDSSPHPSSFLGGSLHLSSQQLFDLMQHPRCFKISKSCTVSFFLKRNSYVTLITSITAALLQHKSGTCI